MIRPTILAAAMISLMLAGGCDNAAEEQKKATNAQNEANTKINEANADAEKKATAAQAEADKKIAAAQANFAKLVEDYRHKATTDLTALDLEVEKLDAKAKKATGKAKADLDAKLAQIRARRDAYAADLKSLETGQASTWDAAKARVDKEWTELKALVDGA